MVERAEKIEDPPSLGASAGRRGFRQSVRQGFGHGTLRLRVFSKVSQSVRNWDQSVVARPAPMDAPRRLASVALPRAPSAETPSTQMLESGGRGRGQMVHRV